MVILILLVLWYIIGGKGEATTHPGVLENANANQVYENDRSIHLFGI